MEFLFDYLSFLLKVATIVTAILVVVSVTIAASVAKGAANFRKHQRDTFGHLEVRHLNEFYDHVRTAMEQAAMSPEEAKKAEKSKKRKKDSKTKETDSKKQSEDSDSGKQEEEETETETESDKHTLFVINFEGDIDASRTSNLRHEISAVLTRASEKDEVLVKVESSGGFVHSYGYAASQLLRLKKAGLHLTVAVDKVAASGGYMVAVVADKIMASPFAVVGSIGVAAELPNVNRLLKKHDVDYEVITAGEHKRTLSMFGENTDEARAKFIEEMEDVHGLFKEFVVEHRQQVDLDVVSTGESWYGERALKINLVDELQTSDEFIMSAVKDSEVYEVSWVIPRKPLSEVLTGAAEVVAKMWNRFSGRVK